LLPFSDSDSKTNILIGQFSKAWLSLRSNVFRNLSKRRKKCSYRKNIHFVLFHVFTVPSDFSELLLFYSSIWIRILTFFGFGSGQNLCILSDSDPQHCSSVNRISLRCPAFNVVDTNPKESKGFRRIQSENKFGFGSRSRYCYKIKIIQKNQRLNT
jgi:hypothetical protein